MGTRGLIGFYKNGTTKATYNHFDSYPDGVGKVVYNEVAHSSLTMLNKAFANIKMIKDEEKVPGPDYIKRYSKFMNKNVGEAVNGKPTWYQLLREVQGSLKPYITLDVEHMIDSSSFIKDSLFCEWAYIVNLDSNKFEVWQGFQKRPQKNRYQTVRPSESGYWSCKRIKTYPLERMPPVNVFLNDMKKFERQ